MVHTSIRPLAVPVLAMILSAVAGTAPAQTSTSHTITMSDGITLDAQITFPAGTAPATGYPGIILIHGYGGKREDMEIVSSFLASRTFASLAYSVRGQGRSGGLSTTMGPREQEDLRTVLAFFRSYPGMDSNRIGVAGGSQGGIHAWIAATANMPGVAAVGSLVGPPSFALDLLPGDCIKQQMYFELNLANVRYDPLRDRVKSFIIAQQLDSVRAFAVSRDLEHLLDSVRVPVVQSGGWADVLFPGNGLIRAVHRLSARGVPIWTYLGTNGHGEPLHLGEYFFLIDFMAGWFDRWLREIPLPQADLPLVVYADDRPAWPHHQTVGWPPQPHGTVRLYCDGDALRPSIPGSSGSAQFTLVYDTTYIPQRGWDDGYGGEAFRNAFSSSPARFVSPPLEDTLDITGIPTARLHLRAGTPPGAPGPPDARVDFQAHVRVFDVSGAEPAQVWTLVTRGHAGVRSSIPGTTVERDLECQALSHRVPPGHRIGLEISSLDMYDTTRAHIIPYFSASATSVLTGPLTPSSIDIPVVGEAQFSTIAPSVHTVAGAYVLHQNYPNPFNPATMIVFSLPAATWVRIDIHSMTGERVAVLHEGVLDRGEHQIRFDGRHLASGVYVYRLSAGGTVLARTMLLLR